MSETAEPTIALTKRADYWVAVHNPTGVGAQAPTREAVLDELDQAVALHENDASEPLANEDELLREIGITPEEMPEGHEDAEPLPESMQ